MQPRSISIPVNPLSTSRERERADIAGAGPIAPHLRALTVAAQCRRGSVLILVVALLVLMALLGTAYISTTRIDRQTSSQHIKNVQIDMLVQGVVNQVTAKIQGDLYNGSASSTSFRQPDSTSYRDPNDVATANNYDDYDGFGFATPFDVRGTQIPGSSSSPNVAEDSWLASRMPWTEGAAPLVNGVKIIGAWPAVSYPITQVSTPSGLPGALWEFDSPYSVLTKSPTIPPDSPPIGSPPDMPFALALPYEPTSGSAAGVNFTAKPWFFPRFVNIRGVNYPALQAYAWNQTSSPPILQAVGAVFLAGDADGDGIADCGLSKLPIGEIDGITYYAGVRIIDNNSALNVNSAMSNVEYNGFAAPTGTQTTFSTTPSAYPGRYYTPASEGLAEMLRTTIPYNKTTPTPLSAQGNEIKALVSYWFNNIFPPGIQGSGVGNNPYPDNNNPSNTTSIGGFQDQSLQTTLNRLVGQRPDNPGYDGSGGSLQTQSFSSTETMTLAYHFGLLNPEASRSTLESTLINSIFQAAANFGQSWSAYGAADVANWYNQNFDFESEPGKFMPRRTMFVASNPVSWQAPVHQIPTGQIPPAPNTYQRLDPYVLASGMENYLPNAAFVTASTVVSESKTSINQAPFSDLWRAFWNVMAERVTVPSGLISAGTIYDGSPFDLRMRYAAKVSGGYVRAGGGAFPDFVDMPTFYDPYLGTKFDEYVAASGAYAPYQDPTAANQYDPTKDMAVAGRPTDYNPARMFRSPIRAVPNPTITGGNTPGFDGGTPCLNTDEVTLLRSAIAAVNAEDLRDSDDDVTAQRILLQPTHGLVGNSGSPSPAEAIVYGTERQPYITEVYVDTDVDYKGGGSGSPNPYGYVAIELYNPYDQDIPLTNWKIVAIDRRSGAIADTPPYRSTTTHDGVSAPLHNLPLDKTTLIADFDPADENVPGDNNQDVILGGSGGPAPTTNGGVWGSAGTGPLVVPARGYLLLENYYDSTDMASNIMTNPVAKQPPLYAAGHRPPGTGLPATGAIRDSLWGNATSAVPNPRGTMPRLNVACVPGLSGIVDNNWQTTEWQTNIRSVINREMIILKPRRADGQYSYGTYPALPLPGGGSLPPEQYDERPNLTTVAGVVAYSHLRDLVPVDSFDFTGLQLPTDASAAVQAQPPLGRGVGAGAKNSFAEAWHYARQNVESSTPISAAMPSDWKMVYPGRYSASPPTPGATITRDANLAGDPLPRQQGTQYISWPMISSGASAGDIAWTTITPPQTVAGPVPCGITLGTTSGGTTDVANCSTHASYPTSFSIPLAFGNFALDPTASGSIGRNTIGESPLLIGSGVIPPEHYPFGGFAREGDILATPFIGAYSIRWLGAAGSDFTVLEINSVSMDSVFAEDTDIFDDPVDAVDATTYNGTIQREEVGRFCPVRVLLNYDAAHLTSPATSDYTNYPTIAYGKYSSNTPGIIVNDFAYDPSYLPGSSPAVGANWEPLWRYHWAVDLFDYLTVRSPSDDYLPDIPMQKAWNYNSTWTQQQEYFPGDLVSYYNPSANLPGGRRGPAHEVYLCNAAGPATGTAPGGGFTLLFQCEPIKDSTTEITFTGDNNQGEAAFRVNQSLVDAGIVTPQQAYDDAHREDNVPVQGLININTADWKVLSALPLVVNPNTGLPDDSTLTSVFPWFSSSALATKYPNITFRQLNQEMAKAIVYYRDVNGNVSTNMASAAGQPHGPFKSISELNQVVDLRPSAPSIAAANDPSGYPQGTPPGFQNGYWTIPVPTSAPNTEPNDSLGDFSPADQNSIVAQDGVRGDYEERNLQLTRISNMITTHSDSFTCYILVQGWRNAETSNPQLVVQRRVGYLIDRSRISPLTPDAMSVVPFPNN